VADADERGGLRIVFLGAPGSGKGTQAERLAERWAIPAVSTGGMLRAAVAAGSDLGRRVESIMASGALVDDATMAEVVAQRLSARDAAGGFILDGYPRTASQVETLDGILEKQRSQLDHAIYLEVDERALVARATARGRADDSEAVVQQRLRVYREDTAPLVDTYHQRGLLRRIDGGRSIEAVAAELDELLG
jgi:adenylate kinase